MMVCALNGRVRANISRTAFNISSLRLSQGSLIVWFPHIGALRLVILAKAIAQSTAELPRKFVRQYPLNLLTSAHGRPGHSNARSDFLQPRFKMGRFHF